MRRIVSSFPRQRGLGPLSAVTSPSSSVRTSSTNTSSSSNYRTPFVFIDKPTDACPIALRSKLVALTYDSSSSSVMTVTDNGQKPVLSSRSIRDLKHALHGLRILQDGPLIKAFLTNHIVPQLPHLPPDILSLALQAYQYNSSTCFEEALTLLLQAYQVHPKGVNEQHITVVLTLCKQTGIPSAVTGPSSSSVRTSSTNTSSSSNYRTPFVCMTSTVLHQISQILCPSHCLL